MSGSGRSTCPTATSPTASGTWINVWEQVGLEPPSDRSPFAIWLDAVHPDDKDRVLRYQLQSYLNGETKDYEVEYRARDKDGTYRWMLTRGTAIRDQAGRPIRFVGSRVDITELKRVEEAERRAKEAAEAASRAKSEFLANVSHEIRTPMNAILGMTELAIDTPRSDEQRQYLTIVKSSADALLDVINDLLDFSKIEAGKLELDPADSRCGASWGRRLRPGPPRPQERAGARLPDPAGRPRRPDRRCRAAPADPAQSRRQRDQVHGGGRSRRPHRG